MLIVRLLKKELREIANTILFKIFTLSVVFSCSTSFRFLMGTATWFSFYFHSLQRFISATHLYYMEINVTAIAELEAHYRKSWHARPVASLSNVRRSDEYVNAFFHSIWHSFKSKSFIYWFLSKSWSNLHHQTHRSIDRWSIHSIWLCSAHRNAFM